MRVADQTAIVTGAAKGIGRGIARRLGSEGANIVIADVDREQAQETGAELRSEGIEVDVVECDVTAIEDTERLATRTRERFGRIDVLVNNAGISFHGPFTDIEPEDWRSVLDVNLTGPYNCSSAVVPTMIEQGFGRIVNISSMAGRSISYHAAANYTASKWGVIGLTKHMAWDLGGDGITVNAICPGSTLTPLIESHTTPDERAVTEEKIPVGRWATPADHAEGVHYLVSEAGSYVNGTVLEIDGGKQLGVRHEI